MNEKKVEQVGEALRQECQKIFGSTWSNVVARQLARAAIEAMRDPTNLMLKAAAASMSEGKRPTPDRVSTKEKHRIRYRAMIDAELNRQTFVEAVATTGAPEAVQ